MTQQIVTLNPGESKVVSFEATPTIAKTYSVLVDGLAGSFVVSPQPVAECAALVIEGSIYENLDFSGWLSEVEADTEIKAGVYKVRVQDLEEALLHSGTKIWMYVGSLGDLWTGFPYWVNDYFANKYGDTHKAGRQPMGLPQEGMWGKTMPGTLAYGAVVSYVIIPDIKSDYPPIPFTDAEKFARAQGAIDGFAAFHQTRQYSNRLVCRMHWETGSSFENLKANVTTFLSTLAGVTGSHIDTGFDVLKSDIQYKPLALVISGHSGFNDCACFDGPYEIYTGFFGDFFNSGEVGAEKPRYFEVRGCYSSYIWCWKENGKFVCTDGSFGQLASLPDHVICELAQSAFTHKWDFAAYLAQGQSLGQAILNTYKDNPISIYGVLYGDPTFTFI